MNNKIILAKRQGNRPCMEIGYLISTNKLNSGDYNSSKTGIWLLKQETERYHEELIIGPESFGAYLSKYDICSVPSPNNPYPSNGEFCDTPGCIPCDCKNWDGK